MCLSDGLGPPMGGIGCSTYVFWPICGFLCFLVEFKIPHMSKTIDGFTFGPSEGIHGASEDHRRNTLCRCVFLFCWKRQHSTYSRSICGFLCFFGLRCFWRFWGHMWNLVFCWQNQNSTSSVVENMWNFDMWHIASEDRLSSFVGKRCAVRFHFQHLTAAGTFGIERWSIIVLKMHVSSGLSLSVPFSCESAWRKTSHDYVVETIWQRLFCACPFILFIADNHRTSGYPDFRIPGYPDILISGYPDIRISEYPGIRISGYPDFRISESPDIRVSGYPDTRISRNPDIRIPEYPGIRISGNPGIRISGYPDIRRFWNFGEVAQRPSQPSPSLHWLFYYIGFILYSIF